MIPTATLLTINLKKLSMIRIILKPQNWLLHDMNLLSFAVVC